MNKRIKTPINQQFKTLKNIGIAAFIAVMLVQSFLRTSDFGFNSETKHLLGVLPNFFAALGICLALYSTHLLQFKRFQINKNQLFIASLLFPIIGLTAWEFCQILFKRPFDIEDIYMTIAGSILGGILILALKHFKTQKPPASRMIL